MPKKIKIALLITAGFLGHALLVNALPERIPVATVLITKDDRDLEAIFIYKHKKPVVHKEDVDNPAVAAVGSKAEYGVFDMDVSKGGMPDSPQADPSKAPKVGIDVLDSSEIANA